MYNKKPRYDLKDTAEELQKLCVDWQAWAEELEDEIESLKSENEELKKELSEK